MRRVNKVQADVASVERAGCDRWELDWTSLFAMWLRAAGGSRSIRSFCHGVMLINSAAAGMSTYACTSPLRLRKWSIQSPDSVSPTYPQQSLYSCYGAIAVESPLTRATLFTTGQSWVCTCSLRDMLTRFPSHRVEPTSGSSVCTLALIGHPCWLTPGIDTSRTCGW